MICYSIYLAFISKFFLSNIIDLHSLFLWLIRIKYKLEFYIFYLINKNMIYNCKNEVYDFIYTNNDMYVCIKWSLCKYRRA